MSCRVCRAVALNPRYIPAIQGLARLLATSPDEVVRNGAEAVKLAGFLLGLPNAGNNPNFLFTGAAAEAENGDFQQARDLARRAVRLAFPCANDEKLADYRSRQVILKEGKPIRMP